MTIEPILLIKQELIVLMPKRSPPYMIIERATPQFMKGLGDFVHHANRNTIIDMDVQLAFDKLRHLLI